MPKAFAPKHRIVSADTKPPGQYTCNGKLSSRDGYCQTPGVKEFTRCKTHGGPQKATSLFKRAVSIGMSEKLEVLLDDTLSMDNELASGKTLLLQVLEQYSRADAVLKAYQENMPQKPNEYATDQERIDYRAAVELHVEMVKMSKDMLQKTFYQAHQLIKTLSMAVHKNNQIKEGTKFTMDAKQISSILRLQLNVMKTNCVGCPKLKMVVKGIREGTKDIPINPQISKNNREILGERKYKEAMDQVQDIVGDIQEADYEVDDG